MGFERIEVISVHLVSLTVVIPQLGADLSRFHTNDVTFNISENYVDPWTFTSSDGRFEMSFEPIIDRAAVIDLKAIITDQHQVFGRMSGTAILDDGTKIEIKDFLCFAEKVHNKY